MDLFSNLLDEGDPEELLQLHAEIAQGAYGSVFTVCFAFVCRFGLCVVTMRCAISG